MYYSSIGVLAVLVLIIVNWDILNGINIPEDKPAWKVYRRFLFVVLAYYVTDILWGFLENQKLSAALFADTTVYFVAMSVGISFWADYTATYLNEKNSFGKVLIIAGRVITGLILIMAVINIFTPMLFTVDKDCVYTALPLRYIMLVCQILMLIVISVYALSSMFRSSEGREGRTRYRIIASFGFIMAVILFVQLWFPYLPLYSIGYMLGTCLLHAFVADDAKEEYRRGQEETQKITELKDTIISLVDNMPGMTFTKDANTGVYLACNQAFAEYARKEKPSRVVGLTDAEIFDAETAAHFVEDDKMALSLSKPYIFFEDVLDAAGNHVQLQTTKLKYKDISGRLCVLGMCQDVSDVVRIQHEQAMTQEAYEKAVSSGLMYNQIAQTLARDYLDMYYVNTDTEEFIEYRHDEKDGSLSEVRRGYHFFSDCRKELAENVYEDDREEFLQAIKRKQLMKALSRKDTFVMSYRQTTENGQIYVSMKISRMEDEHYIIMGITNVDAEMRETMAKNKALAEAISSAEQANKAKTAFLSDMGHEIRTPLNAIIGIDTLALKNNELDEKTRDYLEKIGESANNLRSIINDILDMSMLESGRVSLNKEEFSFGAMLEQINTMAISRCDDKGLSYECNILNQVDNNYFGDDAKLKEVLNNILSNAVKFTDAPGNVTMTVEKTAEFEGQSTLRFCIKDTGIGMDKDYLPKLFEAFSQENTGLKTNNGSSGLGMAITKRMVEIMNGTIDVESEKGVGTMFTVTVTLRNSNQKEMKVDQKLDPATIYILVVDDDLIEAEHAKSVLEEVGFRADFCTSGQEALRKMEVQHVKHKPYNIVLMDWNMPGMSGSETSAEIHKLYENESTVIALTAYSWDDIREEARRVGVESFLSKPLFASNVIENIERIANRSSMPILKDKQRAKLTGRRILIAEDVEINAEILKDALEIENIKSDHAENGKVAVELFENSTAGIYSAILMDVRMPLMDGLEATKAIRAMDREDAKKIPIIALTANTFDDDVKASLQAGMNAHLSKPVDADQLVRILGELIYEAES